jgi:hypothetical protein
MLKPFEYCPTGDEDPGLDGEIGDDADDETEKPKD